MKALELSISRFQVLRRCLKLVETGPEQNKEKGKRSHMNMQSCRVRVVVEDVG